MKDTFPLPDHEREDRPSAGGLAVAERKSPDRQQPIQPGRASSTTTAGGPASTTQCKSSTRAARLFGSYVLLALVLLVGLEIGSRILYRPNPFDSPNRSWAWWAAQSWLDGRLPPSTVALFGSSLMFAVVNDTDAYHSKTTIDAVTHFRSSYLEQLLSRRFDRNICTASFAIGGEMASDAYAIASTLFKEKHPSYIVWGIAPRDFVDSCFGRAESTDIVRYMEKAAGAQVLDRPGTSRGVEPFLGSISYLYQRRADIECDTARILRGLLGTIGFADLEHKHAPAALLKLAADHLPDDNAPSQWMTRPILKTRTATSDDERKREYEMRYRPFKQKTFDEQLYYFDRFLSLAYKRNIPVLLVNMPLMESNMRILPPGVYEKYLAAVSQLALKRNADFFDLNKPGIFSDSHFSDPVHLNGEGGAKLLSMVSDRIRHVAGKPPQTPVEREALQEAASTTAAAKHTFHTW